MDASDLPSRRDHTKRYLPLGTDSKPRRRRRSPLGLFSAGGASRDLGSDLPQVTVGIGENRGAHAPLAVDRAVEERDSATRQLLAHRVGVVDPDRELEPRAGLS